MILANIYICFLNERICDLTVKSQILTKTSVMENEKLREIMKLLGHDLTGMKASEGDLFSMAVIGIVSLQAEIHQLRVVNKKMQKKLMSISQIDAFKKEVYLILHEKK